MRYIILLLVLCLPATAADSTSSVNASSKRIRESYEQKSDEWMLSHFDTNGVPAEIASFQEQVFKNFWRSGDLKVTSVKAIRLGDYKASAAPGTYFGRKLRYLGRPTHWIVLRAESPKPKLGEESAYKTQVKLELPVFQKDGRWWISGLTYAD